MSDQASQKAKRPLSPHLQVYRPQMTSVLSILHRATGFALAVGLVLFTWWLVAASIGPDAYQVFTDFVGSGLGRLMLLGWIAAFYYHMANGIRHLIWDSGFLLKIQNAYAAGYVVLLVAVVLTAGTWLCFTGGGM